MHKIAPLRNKYFYYISNDTTIKKLNQIILTHIVYSRFAAFQAKSRKKYRIFRNLLLAEKNCKKFFYVLY